MPPQNVEDARVNITVARNAREVIGNITKVFVIAPLKEIPVSGQSSILCPVFVWAYLD